MLSNRIQIVRTLTTQRWQCTHCSQKPVADSDDDQKAPVLDKKSPGVHQPQFCNLKWNANGIHRELPLQEDLLEANNVDVVCIQETKQQPKDKNSNLRNISAVRRDRLVQGGTREWHHNLHSKTDSLQIQPPKGQQLKRNEKTDDRESNHK